MKKTILIYISVTFTSITMFAQSKILKKDSLFNPTTPKKSIDFIGRLTINNDSTLARTSNGFDVKKSKIDNMVYLNINEANPALNKMPVAISSIPVEPMPVAQFQTYPNLSLKDTGFNIFLNNDFLKRLKKN